MEQRPDQNKDELASYVTEKTEAWKTWRDNNYKDRWDEYYRLFRGFWTEGDKNRKSERSRIIAPELSQAVETSVAEIEDAIFARDRWIDVDQDTDDMGKEDASLNQQLHYLLDDFEAYGVKHAVSEIVLNGALYGTGIGKVVVDRIKVPRVDQTGIPGVVQDIKYVVRLVPMSPRNTVIDPDARTVDDALGVAHDIKLPLSVIQKRINDGIYRDIPLRPYKEEVESLQALAEFSLSSDQARACRVVEWHGLVPESMIDEKEKLFDEIEKEIADANKDLTTIGKTTLSGTDKLVEAIVVVVNDEYVARAVRNPFLLGDRSIVAYAHDTVPDRFWGRGIAEKGYNPQKALDAEVRARIDALALSTAPMMGIDSTKIPRGQTFSVTPGKNILTVGNPSESLMPIKFPPPDPYTFQQTQELREMIQRGTGSYELPANVDNSRMAATSMSMVVGSMIKRSRRTLANIERNLLSPFVKKAMWRYMQFDPKRFPLKDYNFKVKSSMGIMAREFEQGQLVSLLSTVPNESPAFWMLMKGIYQNSSIDEREKMMQFCDQMMEQAANPQPPPPDPKVAVDMERLKAEMEQHKDKMDIEARKLMHLDEAVKGEAARDVGEGHMQTATAVLQMVKSETEQLKVQSEAYLNLAKAEAEQQKAELDLYKARLEEMKIRMDAAMGHAQLKADVQTTNHELKKEAEDGAETDPETGVTESVEIPEIDEPDEIHNEEPDKLTPLFEKLISSIEKQTETLSSKSISQTSEDRVFNTASAHPLDEQLGKMVPEMHGKVMANKEEQPSPQIERDQQGLVTHINGKPVKRDDKGLLMGVEDQ